MADGRQPSYSVRWKCANERTSPFMCTRTSESIAWHCRRARTRSSNSDWRIAACNSIPRYDQRDISKNLGKKMRNKIKSAAMKYKNSKCKNIFFFYWIDQRYANISRSFWKDLSDYLDCVKLQSKYVGVQLHFVDTIMELEYCWIKQWVHLDILNYYECMKLPWTLIDRYIYITS